MNFSTKEIPSEVLETMLIMKMKTPIGTERWKRCKITMENYPEYFQDYFTYQNIPLKVHEEYENERQNLENTFYPRPERKAGEGLWEASRRVVPQKITKDSLKKCLEYVFITAPKKREEYEKQLEILWNKYYKIYGLKYEK